MVWNDTLPNSTCTNYLQNNETTNQHKSFYPNFVLIFASVLVPIIVGIAVWKWNSPWVKSKQKVREKFKNIQTSVQNYFKKWRTILPYVLPPNTRRTQITLFTFATLIIAIRVLNFIIPLSHKWIMDKINSAQPSLCYKFILISGGLEFLNSGILSTLETILWKDLQMRTSERIRTDAFSHIHRLPLQWRLEKSAGEIHSMIQRGSACIGHTFHNVFLSRIPLFFDIIVAMVYCAIQFNLSVVAFLIILVLFYSAVKIILHNYRQKYSKKESETYNELYKVSYDSLVNYETVKHYCAEKLEEERFLDAFRKYKQAEWEDDLFWQLITFIEDIITKFATVLGFLAVAYLVVEPEYGYSVGDYVLFTSYIVKLWHPINALSFSFRTISKDLPHMEKIVELLNTEPEIRDLPDAIELEPEPGSIEFHNVSFSYKPGAPILQNVSFCVEPGQTVAIVGPSGSGKTTITRLLFRFYDVTSGRITVNGHDIGKIKMASLRKRIGIVPQECSLFNQTVGFNIKYGKSGSDNFDDVVEAAKAASIYNFINSQKEGFETMVGERGLKLSGGEKQRVAIARATLKRPHYVVLDEATSALDTKTEREIQRTLLDLCSKKTCIIIAHRLSTIIHAHKIVVMNNEGRVAEIGSHEELLAMDGLYAEMWRIQL